MTVRIHAALWIVAIALTWLLDANVPDAIVPRPGADSELLRQALSALVDADLARVEAHWARVLATLAAGADLMPCWLPVVIAGVVDGLAARRARRCGLQPAPDVAFRWGCHALVVANFAPLLVAGTPAVVTPWLVTGWAGATSGLLAFTLSRVQGLGKRD